MSATTIEARVERLERLVEELRASFESKPGRDDWRATIGMFTGDPLAKEIIDEALRLRDEERKQVAP
jgi:hypothetical protein